MALTLPGGPSVSNVTAPDLTSGLPLSEPWVDSPQWFDREQVSDIKLHRRFDEPFDALAAYVNNIDNPVPSNMQRYFGVCDGSNGAITGPNVVPARYNYQLNNNIWRPYAQDGFNVIQYGGIFCITACIRQSQSVATSGAVSWNLSIEGAYPGNLGQDILGPPLPSGQVGVGGSVGATLRIPDQCSIEIQIVGGTFTPSTDFASYLSICQLGW